MVADPVDPGPEERTGPTMSAPSGAPGSGETAATATPPPGSATQTFRVGQVLGDRYDLRARLGSGGMGEVWLATDLKLRIEVALKSVRPDYLANEGLREVLRREVLAAREVLSPNVCRVFDLQVMEGHELVAMEYVAGRTLADLFKERTPLPLREGRDLAAQFLAGLEAIHDAGLVHRDFKPENVMVTPVGRVVVMDLGLAARPAVTGGRVAGTPAYMSPEQERGEELDARTDVFAAGIVLAEMIAPAGTRDRGKRVTLWEGLRQAPPRIPEGPWTPVIRKAVSSEPSERYGSARELSRELDGLTLRVGEGEGIEPYPGLAAFTAENAERFFGREAEVEALLRKLGRARLLAIAGPSGAGKTSFVQAGLIPALSEGWGHLVVHPRDAPFEALGRALTRLERRGRHPEGASPGASPEGSLQQPNGEILRRTPGDKAPQDDGGRAGDGLVEALRQWREDHEQALLVVDQFEELFTLNPQETQAELAQLLGRLPLEADVHVLLSMRDDFLLRCREHEALGPAFAELTPLVHPSGAALRRALVQPALSCGYRFEDEALVEAMLAQVEHERGALPLLAFAARRLWEKRDREAGTLTRSAYEEIGGVGGALAHHAEETLERIGPARVPIVREIFRNLVTAEGTRASRKREELLSVFEPKAASGEWSGPTVAPGGAGRQVAGEVLDALIEARLLTSYETREGAGEGSTVLRRRIEIIHESLLAAWPRLVRWQAQDADGAQLRDQLRQAAEAWSDRGRLADLLWTGSAYREFALWRERYPGGLSATEEAFARAMEEQANRARKRRRLAGISFVAAVTLVAAALAVLWRQSEEGRRNAEAANILSLGRMRLQDHPTAALAHAIASLERADNEPARRFAVQALWRGPLALVVRDPINPAVVQWSPDGRFLAMGGQIGFAVLDRDAGSRRHAGDALTDIVGFSGDSSRLATADLSGRDIDLWALPGLEPVARWTRGARAYRTVSLLDRRLRTWEKVGGGPVVLERSIDGGEPVACGRWPSRGVSDATGAWVASIEDGQLVKRRFESLEGEATVLGPVDDEARAGWHPWSDRMATADARGQVQVWDAETGRVIRSLITPTDARGFTLDPSGRYIATGPQERGIFPGSLHLVDLAAPQGALPQALAIQGVEVMDGWRFHPEGRFLATGHISEVFLWNLETRRPIVFEEAGTATAVAFAPDGRLISTSHDGAVKLWPLFADIEGEMRVLRERERRNEGGEHVDVSADGRFAVTIEGGAGRVLVLPLDGSAPAGHDLFESRAEEVSGRIRTFHLSPNGQQVATTYFQQGAPDAPGIRILDLSTGNVRKLFWKPGSEPACMMSSPALGPVQFPHWLPDGRLISDGALGLRLWNLEDGSSRRLRECRDMDGVAFGATPDSATILTLHSRAAGQGEQQKTLTRFDLDTGVSQEILDHGNAVSAFAVGPAGATLVTGSTDGVVRVGALAGGATHLLFGHQDAVTSVAVSPDGRWVASAADDDSIRLWPMPNVAEPPLQTWPRDELLEKLRSLTNLRVVSDPGSSTGYSLEPGPFPGWESSPTW